MDGNWKPGSSWGGVIDGGATPQLSWISADPWGGGLMAVLWKKSCTGPAPEVFSHEGHYGNGKGLLSPTWLIGLDTSGEGPVQDRWKQEAG